MCHTRWNVTDQETHTHTHIHIHMRAKEAGHEVHQDSRLGGYPLIKTAIQLHRRVRVTWTEAGESTVLHHSSI